MIQRSLNQTYRTAALVGAAVVFSTVAASQLRAQALNNLFGGTSGATTLTVTPATVTVNATTGTTGSLGSGYAGMLIVNNGVGSAFNETLNTTAGTLAAATGGAVSLGGTFEASKSFATAGLQPNTAYQFSVTKASGSTLSLLTGLNFTLGANGTTFASTATGFGILGGASVNALSLFNTNNTATFVFTTPATVTANSTLSFDVTGQIGVNTGLLGPTTFTLGNAAISQVPEPGTLASACVGLLGLGFWRSRRGFQVA